VGSILFGVAIDPSGSFADGAAFRGASGAIPLVRAIRLSEDAPGAVGTAARGESRCFIENT
jgi:hypothetical protein